MVLSGVNLDGRVGVGTVERGPLCTVLVVHHCYVREGRSFYRRGFSKVSYLSTPCLPTSYVTRKRGGS